MAAGRATYRHGDLRNALIQAGLELTGEGGPDAVVLREATRRAGVVPNAAYRHFADRRALLSAVSQAALARLAVTMEAELETLPPASSAIDRVRAMVTGYLRFATSEPGLFRAAFATTGMADTSDEAAVGVGGRTAFQLLNEALDELASEGVLPAGRRPGAEYFVWSAVHGLAVLRVDGPLRGLPDERVEDAVRRVMDSIERGL